MEKVFIITLQEFNNLDSERVKMLMRVVYTLCSMIEFLISRLHHLNGLESERVNGFRAYYVHFNINNNCAFGIKNSLQQLIGSKRWK